MPSVRPSRPIGARVFVLLPAPGAQLDDAVGDPPIQATDQGEGELGHGRGVLARAVRDVDAALARDDDVDVADRRRRRE